MDPYLWNGRILKEEDVDRYLNRIVHEKRNRIIKYVLIGIAGASMVFALVILGANKQKENTGKSEKVINVNQQPVNPVATIAYNSEAQYTK